MNIQEPQGALPLQRWVRPSTLNAPPGFWKQQLAGKYLDLAGRGDIAALQQLLERHPEYLNKRGPHNRTLLWEAARKGKLDAVRWLVAQGAELDATGCYNSESYVQLTPYCTAVYYHRKYVAAYLHAQGAQLDIFRAAYMGEEAQVASELAAHPEMLNAEDPYDATYYTPLLAFAVAGGQEKIVDLLLQRGAVVDVYSVQLLSLAVRSGRFDTIERLVAHGADVRTAHVGIFVSASDVGIIAYLLAHGAPTAAQEPGGLSALSYVARGDKGEHAEKVKMLLEFGAAVNAVGPQGRTALHYAASAGFLQVITLLLESGADFTLQDDEGRTPLSLARAAGKTAAAALLEKAGALQ